MKKLFTKQLMMLSVLLTTTLLASTAYAQLSLDRTRLIFDRAQSNSQSITLKNTNPGVPYLAQAWVEDEYGHKIEEPLIALPILQRLEPNQEKQVKVSLSGSNSLPNDRESLLYFNVLGIPPKEGNGDGNQVNIVVQSKIKLLYRPKGLPEYPNNGWIKTLEVQKNGNQFALNNPSPYHLIIFGFSNGKKGRLIEKELTIKPFSSQTVNFPLGNAPTVYFINDYGSTEIYTYQCSRINCTLTP